jgi:hypothetical protein
MEICHTDQTKIREFYYKMRRRPNVYEGDCQCPKLLGVFHGLHEKIVETCRQHCK